MSWLSRRLKDLLRERQLSIQRVATELAMPRAYLSLIVNGSRIPSEDLIRKLASHFGEDPEEWAFHAKAEPVMEDFRKKYPNMMPKYARQLDVDEGGRPRYNFSASNYHAFNAPDYLGGREVTQYLPLPTIERYAGDALSQFAYARHLDVEDLEFPLDAELLVRTVFRLDVHYDGEGVLDEMKPGLLGCLYADGSPSPWGPDRLIVVNSAARFEAVTVAFTILHEGGHYVFHHPIDALSVSRTATKYCRFDLIVAPARAKVPPREWQASRFASELLMPKKKVSWLLDGKLPHEVINLEIYGPRFREYFGVSQAAMEKRLYDLGYKCMFGRYGYANLTEPVASNTFRRPR